MTNADIVDNASDIYDPHRPRTGSTAGLGISFTTAVCGVLRIMGTPLWQVILIGVVGILATVGMVIWTRRVWLRNTARPAAMRQAIASIMKQPLPEHLDSQFWRTVRASRYKFGTLREPGPAGRITVNARFLGRIDAKELEEMAEDLARLEGVPYTVRARKNKPGRLVFVAEQQPTRRSRPDGRAQLQQDFTLTAQNVFGEQAQILYDWDDSEPDELVSVKVLGIDRYAGGSPHEQDREGQRLAKLLPGGVFKYVAFPAEKKAQFVRPLPAGPDDAPPAPTHNTVTPRGGSV